MSGEGTERRRSSGITREQIAIAMEEVQADWSRRLNYMEKRMAMLDGNDIDKSGGRVGRLEASLGKLQGLLIVTMIASLGSCVMLILRFLGAK